MTLFEKLGGEQAVSAVVDKFYELMLQDSRVSHFYQGINLGLLKCRQKQFITLVTGGPNQYEGTDMKTAHCKLKISQNDFHTTWENLENAMKHFNVAVELIEEVKEIFYSVQEQIVTWQPKQEAKKQKPQRVQQKQPQQKQNIGEGKKCPFSGKVQSQGGEEKKGQCPFKLNNQAYMRHYY